MNPADEEYEARIVDPDIRRFVEYLRGKRGDGRYPARAALDPLDFRYVLGDVIIIEAHRSPAGSPWPWHFRYRPVGETAPGPDWQITDERFIDDESGKPVTVYIKPKTGERRYVE